MGVPLSTAAAQSSGKEPATQESKDTPKAQTAHHESSSEKHICPAFLSEVADSFRERMTPLLNDQVRGGRTYANAFTGRDAVNQLAHIVKTPDRNLALLVGRSLDAQGYLRDVVCGHRLHDHPEEIYQFGSVALGGGEAGKSNPCSGYELQAVSDDASETSTLVSDLPNVQKPELETPFPTGVLALLTDCYSPTCSKRTPCYSLTCPRSLQQQEYRKKRRSGGSHHLAVSDDDDDRVAPLRFCCCKRFPLKKLYGR